jgi:hypothetical protein
MRSVINFSVRNHIVYAVAIYNAFSYLAALCIDNYVNFESKRLLAITKLL